MIITKNGNIKGIPYTAMGKQGDIWFNLLICRVSLDNTDEDLTALFNTDNVEDDEIGIKWNFTQLIKIVTDRQYK